MAKMDPRPAMSALVQKYQPLTPESPCLPTSLPHVRETIPQLPLTPPETGDGINAAANDEAIRTALHVISTERDALTYLGDLYESDQVAQEGFTRAVNAILRSITNHGKLVVCGVGKSGKIAEKVVATMNSFGIRSTFLHPTEALHGDLGVIGVNDTFLLLTYSGRTPELLSLIPHLSLDLPLIVLTSHTQPSTCPLFFSRPAHLSILLPAPIPTSEVQSFGLPAPTTSTTTALALTDALALACARRLHSSPAAIFLKNHPGGAIGASVSATGPPKIADIGTQVASVPIVRARPDCPSLTVRDVLLTAARSSSGWVRLSSSTIVAPRQVQHLGHDLDLDQSIHHVDAGTVVEKGDWISIPATSSVQEAKDWIESMRQGERGRTFLKEGTILGIVDVKGDVSSVVEIEEIVGDEEVQTWRRHD